MIWLVFTVLVVCSGCVSGSETALFSLSRQSLAEYRRSKSVLHRRVFRLMLRPRQVLMTVLITNTAVNLAIFVISFVGTHGLRKQQPAMTAIIGVVTLLIVVVFGEMLPKAIALSNTRLLAPTAGAFIATMHTMLSPLRWVLELFLVEPLTRLLSPSRPVSDAVSTDELQLLVERSAHEGHINSTENELLQAVVALDEINVREIMTPRVDAVFGSVSSSHDEIQALLERHGARYLMICGRDMDDVRGVLDARRFFLESPQHWSALISPVRYVPEQINLVQLLRTLRPSPSQPVVVVDEYGGTAGFVAMRNVISWLIGARDEEPGLVQEAAVERIDENTYRLAGDLSARVWADRFGVKGIDRHIDTLGGLVLARLGHVPHVPRGGERVRIWNLTLTVESVRRRRIDRVLLHREERISDAEAMP